MEVVVAPAADLGHDAVVGALPAKQLTRHGDARHLGHLGLGEDAPDQQRVQRNLRAEQSHEARDGGSVCGAWSETARRAAAGLQLGAQNSAEGGAEVRTLRRCVKMLLTFCAPSLATAASAWAASTTTAGAASPAAVPTVASLLPGPAALLAAALPPAPAGSSSLSSSIDANSVPLAARLAPLPAAVAAVPPPLAAALPLRLRVARAAPAGLAAPPRPPRRPLPLAVAVAVVAASLCSLPESSAGCREEERVVRRRLPPPPPAARAELSSGAGLSASWLSKRRSTTSGPADEEGACTDPLACRCEEVAAAAAATAVLVAVAVALGAGGGAVPVACGRGGRGQAGTRGFRSPAVRLPAAGAVMRVWEGGRVGGQAHLCLERGDGVRVALRLFRHHVHLRRNGAQREACGFARQPSVETNH